MECIEVIDWYFNKKTMDFEPDDKFISIEELRNLMLIKERQETIKRILE